MFAASVVDLHRRALLLQKLRDTLRDLAARQDAVVITRRTGRPRRLSGRCVAGIILCTQLCLFTTTRWSVDRHRYNSWLADENNLAGNIGRHSVQVLCKLHLGWPLGQN